MIKYDSYKSSGIEWLGEIPSHWDEIPIKAITKVKSIKNKPNEELLSVYRDYGVILKNSRDDNHNKAGQDLNSYKFVEKTNLVLNKMKTWQGSLGVSKYQGIVSPAYIVCKIDIKKVFPKYLNHLLRSNNYIFEYNRLSYGVRTDQWDMRYSDFKNTPLFLPPKKEQEAIANFLDKKLEQVDNYIAKQKELIQLLKEKKNSLINQTVTKSLDPKVEYKESGIEWLGKIPKHWEVIKIKRLIKYTVGGIWGNEKKLNSSDIICVRVADMDYNNFNFSDKNLTIRNILHNERNNRILKKGDLIIEKSGGGEKTPVGRVVKFNLDYDAVCSNFMNKIKIIDKKIISDFLVLMFHILYVNKIVIDSIKQTTGIQNLDINSYLSNLIPIPPKNEQKQIVDYIEKESSKIDKVISTKEDEIKLLDEYKQSLISSAVTGKIKVS